MGISQASSFQVVDNTGNAKPEKVVLRSAEKQGFWKLATKPFPMPLGEVPKTGVFCKVGKESQRNF
jgi:hypothetical protein